MDKIENNLIIPRYLVTLRFIDLPSTDEAEIKNMVEFQALKELPYTKAEMVISYRNLGVYKTGFSFVILAIAQKAIIEKMMAENSGQVASIRLETEILYLNLLKKEIAKPEHVNLVVVIKKGYSEVLVIDHRRLVFSRGFVNESGYVEEIWRTIISYKRDKTGRQVTHVSIVYSKDTDIENIKLHIKEYLNTAVSFYEYTEDLLKAESHLSIELLPQDYLNKKANIATGKDISLTYILVLISLVMITAFSIFKINEKSSALKLISERLEKISPEIDKLNELSGKIKVVEGYSIKGINVMKILESSYEVVPGDVSLSGIGYDGASRFSYNGLVKDMSGVFEFVKALERSKYFKKIDVKYATKKMVNGVEMTDFSIIGEIGL